MAPGAARAVLILLAKTSTRARARCAFSAARIASKKRSSLRAFLCSAQSCT